MINAHTIAKKAQSTPQKVYFIRVSEGQYKRVVLKAQSEDRSINKMANILLKDALDSQDK